MKVDVYSCSRRLYYYLTFCELHGNFTLTSRNFTDCGVLHRWPTKSYKVKQQSVPTKFTPSTTVWNPKYVWNTCIYQGLGAHGDEIFGLFIVFHFTDAQNWNILARVVQALIDAHPDQFHTFPKMFGWFWKPYCNSFW